VTGAGLIQETVLKSAWTSYFLIGPIEEIFKLIAVWVAVYRTSDFREPIDGIVYSASAALGFASVENIVYLAWMGPEVVVSRAVFATPAHVMFSAMWGYSMGLARFDRDGELLIVVKGFLLAAGFHGTYNFLVALHPKAAMITLIPLMVLMAWLMNQKIQEFRRTYPFPAIGEGPLISCPACGAYTLELGETCSRCGSTIPLVESDAPRFCGRCRAMLDPCLESCPRCGMQAYLSRLCPPVPR